MSTTTLWTRLRHAIGSYPTNAREWAVRVQSSDVTRRELLALDAWLKADPRNAEAYARVNKISNLGLTLRDHPEERERLRTYAASRQPAPVWPPRAGRVRWAVGGLALAGALAGVALFIPPPIIGPSGPQYASGRGEQRQVALEDGSRMIVNTDSAVSVDFSSRERAIELSRGEAFFDVARDSSRPFVVRTANAEVRAIGTKFTVRRLEHETEVIVTEGRVGVVRIAAGGAVGRKVERVEVAPGNLARVGEPVQPMRVAAVDPVRATAWTSGNVEFDEARLVEVIHDVNRYSIKQFAVDDPGIADIRFTGRFHVGDTEAVKFALFSRFEIIATEDGGTIRLSRPR